MNLSIRLIAICLLTAACSKKNENSRELVEANRLHLEAIEISKELEARLDSISANSSNDVDQSQIDSLKSLIEVWETNVIEVPGFAHAHDHAHGAHSHKAAPPMTDESMLDYQRQSKEAILELRHAIKRLEK
ncbi:hypothetical protein GCM10010967_00850 [Dyadobacter beijingensis]|uniref:Lipoprotein n=1 Tax=Dyadobacter beijingensis TaxID=365489 RepID=A0ABQ2HBE8_9BACT|nr:hypothetical protein [Dyadobacter beijingensis]GGM73145.1 hypothetical protein GCM10010967_00850 [Dyadobacter beijingensis]